MKKNTIRILYDTFADQYFFYDPNSEENKGKVLWGNVLMRFYEIDTGGFTRIGYRDFDLSQKEMKHSWIETNEVNKDMAVYLPVNVIMQLKQMGIQFV